MKKKLKIRIEDLTFEQKVEYQKLKNERFKSYVELSKWIIISVGAVISFLVIDIGNLKVAEFKADTAHEENLLESYLESAKTANPDLWTRKLRLIREFSNDSVIINWAVKEEEYIKNKAALLSLYKETVSVSSILANENLYETEEWKKASKRYYQLYWAELPFYGETKPVIIKMIKFKNKLDSLKINEKPDKWREMNNALHALSTALKKESQLLEAK